MKSLSRKVDSFDGQTITVDGKPGYELGGFLGGGAAGVVYEGTDVSERSHAKPVAIKILNPVGFRLAPEDTLRRCVVARRGRLPSGAVENGTTLNAKNAGSVHVSDIRTTMPPASFTGNSAGSGTVAGSGAAGGLRNKSPNVGNNGGNKLGPEHVWWLVSPNTKQVLAAYIDSRYGNLVELPLPKCIEIWGYNPRTEFSPSPSSGSLNGSARDAELGERADGADGIEDSNSAVFDRDCEGFDNPGFGPGTSGTGGVEVQVDGMGVSIPWVPPKFVEWLAQRRKVRREICNMSRVGGHRNVVELLSVLEFLQDSKSTLFLILELVTGLELLDHIRPVGDGGRGSGSRGKFGVSALSKEGARQRYFGELLAGLSYCHRQGVCHRDLSLSNLLLAESPQGDSPPELKIADFGLSACCAVPCQGNGNKASENLQPDQGFPVRVKSIVGSPFYMAPEVTNGNAHGYDGFKADAWSCGVVLYTMLTATLPFGRELNRCPRYKRWRKWAEKHRIGAKKPATSNLLMSLPLIPPLPPSSSKKITDSSATESGSYSSPAPSSSSTTPSVSTDGNSSTNPTTTRSPPPSSTQATTPTATPASPPAPPQWLFPSSHISPLARSLLVSLLTPDPSRRMSIDDAAKHPWLVGPWSFVTEWKSPWEKAHDQEKAEEKARVAAARRERKPGALTPEEMFDAMCVSSAPTTSFP